MGQQDIDPIVRVSHVYLDYVNGRNRGTTIIEDASFSIQHGEKFVIIGPSGCGKTTLLNANDIWRRTGVTIVLVTHSIQEAVFLGHRVLVMSSSPAQIREIVDTSQAEKFGSNTFTDLSTHLRSLLIRDEATPERLAELSAVE